MSPEKELIKSRDDVTLGQHPIFRTLADEHQAPVKSLGEIGLTKVAVCHQDRKGNLQVTVRIVTHETREALIALLDDEMIA